MGVNHAIISEIAAEDDTAATYNVSDSVGIYFVKPASVESVEGGFVMAPTLATDSSANVLRLMALSFH